MERKKTDCKTLERINKTKKPLRVCPFDECCHGGECFLLGTDEELKTPEDKRQEALILSWLIESRGGNN
jgi:hypothetical protein